MGYYFWKLGIIKFWQKNVLEQFHLPEKEKKLENKII